MAAKTSPASLVRRSALWGGGSGGRGEGEALFAMLYPVRPLRAQCTSTRTCSSPANASARPVQAPPPAGTSQGQVCWQCRRWGKEGVRPGRTGLVAGVLFHPGVWRL